MAECQTGLDDSAGGVISSKTFAPNLQVYSTGGDSNDPSVGGCEYKLAIATIEWSNNGVVAISDGNRKLVSTLAIKIGVVFDGGVLTSPLFGSTSIDLSLYNAGDVILFHPYQIMQEGHTASVDLNGNPSTGEFSVYLSFQELSDGA